MRILALDNIAYELNKIPDSGIYIAPVSFPKDI
jgi:hypothetical protein